MTTVILLLNYQMRYKGNLIKLNDHFLQPLPHFCGNGCFEKISVHKRGQ